MSGTIYVSNKDVHALKICVASAAAGSEVKAVVLASPSDLPRTCVLPLPKAGLPVYVSPAGVAIQDVNAAAKLAGGASLHPPALAGPISDLLEFESKHLYPALHDSSSSNLEAVLRELEARLKGKKHLLGDTLTVADIVIACDLVCGIPTRMGVIAEFVDRIRGADFFKLAVDSLGLSADDADLQRAFDASVAAAKAALPKLPKPGERNILITSALPYVNNVPHLGNIIGCVLSADVYSRYCRARGYNSLYVCGTDEYGTATETKAIEEGLTCQEICDKYHAIHKSIYEWFDIDFDKFGRTPTRHQTEICQHIFQKIYDRGMTTQSTSQQLYSTALNKFLADRFVVGTCPKCQYADARGDQCDQCGNLLEPTDLINPRCKFSGTTPVLRETSHLYINLPKLTDELTEYVATTSGQGGWSSNCKAVTNTWLRDGLKERCITRDLKWGTPVPLDGYRDKVFYVWFDAPIGYLSITANYTLEWERWWRNPEEVELVQFMGKDNVTFHTIIFPSTLLGTGEKWTMMKKISVTEYLNYEGGKFSKSRGTGVFGNDVSNTGIPVEIFRYYLLACRPESMDTDFRWADLAARNNNELLNNLGNFVNRAIPFAHKAFGGVVPTASEKGMDRVKLLNDEVGELCDQYLDCLEKIKIRDGIAKAMMVSAAGNKFFQDEQPWVLMKTDKEHAATIVAAALGVVKVLAALLQPYMPSLSRKILEQLNGPWEWTSLGDAFAKDARAVQAALPSGHKLNAPAALIRKIEDSEVAQLQERFSGRQSDQAGAASSSSAAPAASSTGSTKAKGGATDGKRAASKKADGKGATEKGAKGADKGKPAAADRPVDISRVDLRVGLIQKAWQHPDADSLFVEEIMCGEEEPRTVVSGLVKHYSEAEMQNRRVVVVANLKPANMRGIKSHAMVLAATGADGKVELVDPPADAKPGDRVYVEGYEGEPDPQMNPKHKIFEQVVPDLLTNAELQACYKGLPLRTATGICTVPSVAAATIK